MFFLDQLLRRAFVQGPNLTTCEFQTKWRGSDFWLTAQTDPQPGQSAVMEIRIHEGNTGLAMVRRIHEENAGPVMEKRIYEGNARPAMEDAFMKEMRGRRWKDALLKEMQDW